MNASSSHRWQMLPLPPNDISLITFVYIYTYVNLFMYICICIHVYPPPCLWVPITYNALSVLWFPYVINAASARPTTLLASPSYIHIYIYICVFVCVYAYIPMYLYLIHPLSVYSPFAERMLFSLDTMGDKRCLCLSNDAFLLTLAHSCLAALLARIWLCKNLIN